MRLTLPGYYSVSVRDSFYLRSPEFLVTWESGREEYVRFGGEWQFYRFSLSANSTIVVHNIGGTDIALQHRPLEDIVDVTLSAS